MEHKDAAEADPSYCVSVREGRAAALRVMQKGKWGWILSFRAGLRTAFFSCLWTF